MSRGLFGSELHQSHLLLVPTIILQRDAWPEQSEQIERPLDPSEPKMKNAPCGGGGINSRSKREGSVQNEAQLNPVDPNHNFRTMFQAKYKEKEK